MALEPNHRLTAGEIKVMIRLIDAENEFQRGEGESFEPEIVSAREKLERQLALLD